MERSSPPRSRPPAISQTGAGGGEQGGSRGGDRRPRHAQQQHGAEAQRPDQPRDHRLGRDRPHRGEDGEQPRPRGRPAQPGLQQERQQQRRSPRGRAAPAWRPPGWRGRWGSGTASGPGSAAVCAGRGAGRAPRPPPAPPPPATCPQAGTRLRPPTSPITTTPVIARAESAKPVASNRPGWGWASFGTKRSTASIPSRPTGTLTKKIHGQSATPRISPASGGPSRGATIAGVVNQVMAETSLSRGGRAHHDQPAHRRHHRAARALHQPRRHELAQGVGASAQHRAQQEQRHGRHEHPPRAEPFGHPGAGRRAHRQRQQVAGQGELEVHRVAVQLSRQGGQGGGEGGGVEELHEQRHAHRHRRPARGGRGDGGLGAARARALDRRRRFDGDRGALRGDGGDGVFGRPRRRASPWPKGAARPLPRPARARWRRRVGRARAYDVSVT